MILYHALSTYQLLHCVVHKETFHKSDRCHILVSENIRDKYPQYERLKNDFFDEVYLYTSSKLFKDKVNVVNNTNYVFEEYLKNNNINLNAYSEILVGCAHNFFGIYLVSNNYEFTLIEDASGLISRPEILESIESNFFYSRYLVCKEYGLFDGSNKLITKIICNLNTQKEGYFDPRVEHFDLVEKMSQLEESTKKRIINFFGIDTRFEINENSKILLTQHFANLKVLTIEQQKEIYDLVVDYFVADESDLIIKPHPDDLLYYEQMYPRSKVIRDKFPSELIPFVFNQKPNEIITITSTAINNLKNYIERVLNFSSVFEKRYEIIHKYFFVLDLINYLNVEDIIYSYKSDALLLKNIIQSHFDNRDLVVAEIDDLSKVGEQGSVVIIDDINNSFAESLQDSKEINLFISKQPKDSIVVFLNSNRHYSFYSYPDKEVFNSLIPVELSVKKTKDVLDDDYSEVLFLLAKEGGAKEMIDKYSYSKELEHSQMKIEKTRLDEQQMRIKVLEGILEATEKRLEYYIHLEAELRKKLEARR